MILIKKLSCKDFKQIENLSLWFPPNGTFLIEGANEAGKSTLFEAIFFGLFGKPLLGKNEDLINYSESVKKAAIDLEVEVEGKTLLIHRELTKGGSQAAYLLEYENGKEVERLKGAKLVNQRIEDSLKLDSQALLNSCFVEQKKLDKLEGANAEDRKKAISKLINLDLMLELEDKLKVTAEDRARLQELTDRQTLAQLSQEIPRLEKELKEVERQLKLITAGKSFKHLKENEAEIQSWQKQIDDLKKNRDSLREKAKELQDKVTYFNELRLYLNLFSSVSSRQAQVQKMREDLAAFSKKQEELHHLESHLPSLRWLKEEWDRLTLEEENQRSLSDRVNELMREMEKSRQEEEKRKNISKEINDLTWKKQAKDEAIARGKKTQLLYRGLGIGSLLIATLLACLTIFNILPWYALFSLILVFPTTYLLFRSQREGRKISQLKGELEELKSTGQKLTGQLEMLSLSQPSSGIDTDLLQLKENKERAEKDLASKMEEIIKRGQEFRISTRDEVIGELESVERKIKDLKTEAEKIPQIEKMLREQEGELEKLISQMHKQGEALRSLNPQTAMEIDALKEELNRIQSELKLRSEDPQSALHQLENQLGELSGRILIKEKENTELEKQIRGILQELEIERTEFSGFSLEELEKEGELLKRKDSLIGLRESLKKEKEELCAKLMVKEVFWDEESASKEREEMTKELRVREIARDILSLAREAIYNKVKPQTEYHMSGIIPLLTANRYQEAQLTENYMIRVWDERAQAYKEKELFSGGTKDQFSLALRLAYAMATLPQERGASPGFIFLDEPFSSFDLDRSRALVELLTRGKLREAFPQVFVISHSQVVDRENFDYYIYMENGRVVRNTIEEEYKSPSLENDLLA